MIAEIFDLVFHYSVLPGFVRSVLKQSEFVKVFCFHLSIKLFEQPVKARIAVTTKNAAMALKDVFPFFISNLFKLFEVEFNSIKVYF